MNSVELNEKITEVSKTIFSYCMAKTPTREEAEDLSQEILYELIKSAENIRDDKAFYAFMWGVAGNIYKQWYRKKLKNYTCELTEDITSDDVFTEEDNNDMLLICKKVQIPLSAPFVRFLQQHKTNKSTPAFWTFSSIKIESEQHFKQLRLRYLCNFP